MNKTTREVLLEFALFVLIATQVHAQGTAFSYQGRLNDGGNSANGIYDFCFTSYDSVTNGIPTSLTQTNIAVTVSSGLFFVTLDFGSSSPFNGSPQWLNVGVRTNGSTFFTTLSPRQPITSVPYAMMATSASNLLGVLSASQLNGAIPAAQLPTTLSNLTSQVATPLNLAGGTNFSASQITRGSWTNASLYYSYKSFFTNYTITTNDVVLNCTGTNQIITLLPANNFPPTKQLIVWSDNLNGSVIITNATGFEAITVPGLGSSLAVRLGSSLSPSNNVTLMVHGGHW